MPLSPLAAVLSLAAPALPATITFDTTPVDHPARAGTGCFDLVSGDVDGDGRLEVYEAGYSAGTNLQGPTVVSRLGPLVDGQLVRGAARRLAASGEFRLAAVPGTPSVVAAGGTPDPLAETLVIFEGAGLTESARVSLGLGSVPTSIAAADASFGEFRFALSSATELRSYLTSSAMPYWIRMAGEPPRVHAALQADTDAQSEWVVTADFKLQLIDSVTGAIDGETGSGNFTKAMLANLDQDPEPELVGIRGTMAAYELFPPALKWSNFDESFADLAVVDQDGDGDDEVIGVTQFRKSLVSYNGSGNRFGGRAFGVSPRRIAVGDVTGDANPEVLIVQRPSMWSVDLGGGCGEAISVLDRDLDVIAEGEADHGPYDQIEIADLDGDGRLEIVSLVGVSDTLPTRGTRVRVADAATARERWRVTSPADALPEALDELTAFAVGQVDADAPLEIVLTGYFTGQNAYGIVVIDGATRAIEMRTVLEPSPGRRLDDFRIGDADADGAPEFVGLARGGGGNGYDERWVVIDAATLATEWLGPTFVSYFGSATIDLVQLDADPGLELVVAAEANGTFVWDVQSRLLQFSVPGVARDAAASAPGAGAYVAIAERDPARLRIVDATTGAARDTVALPAAPNAVMPDPADGNRVVVALDDRFVAVALAERAVVGESPVPGISLAQRGRLLVRTSAAGARWYAGDGVAVWSTTISETESPLFRDGFE